MKVRSLLMMMVTPAAIVTIPAAGAAQAAGPTCGGQPATIVGKGGDDFIEGRGGNDIICGNNGADIIRGNNGNDLLIGGKGPDNLGGGRHNDTIKGGPGKDVAKGAGGVDTLIGGSSRDILRGGAKADDLYGKGGPDKLVGGAGNDFAHGGAKKDTCKTETTVLCDTEDAYVWANNPTAASYTPSAYHSNKPSGGSISVVRSGVGDYQLRFSGYNMPDGTLQASAYGQDARCTVGSWGGAAINVDCYDVSGARVDTRFTVRHTRDTGAAYVWAINAVGNYNAASSYAHNPSGGGINVNRTAQGQYTVTFARQNLPNGNVQVTAYGSSANCVSSGWAGNGLAVTCRAVGTANLVDSRFTALWTADADQAFAWANNGGTASYTPSTTYSNNPSGGGITATRSGTGNDVVEFDGHTVGNGTFLVTPYGTTAFCRIGSWGGDQVSVHCRNSVTGAAQDARFDILFDE